MTYRTNTGRAFRSDEFTKYFLGRRASRTIILERVAIVNSNWEPMEIMDPTQRDPSEVFAEMTMASLSRFVDDGEDYSAW